MRNIYLKEGIFKIVYRNRDKTLNRCGRTASRDIAIKNNWLKKVSK